MTTTLTLHNTATRTKSAFEPADPESVTVYVCGPTVYNVVHIGNGRPAVVFDVLVRLLRVLYPNVTYVSNITDIDDKINAAAAESGEPISDLAERYAATYEEDMAALWVLPPDVRPRATHHIPEIISMIERLIELGHAYEADGHVLFSVTTDASYGELSRRSLEDMIDGARVEVAPYKRDAKDFVLWKPSSDDLPGWDSPWGRGRPGWHIECSAMCSKHLGEQIDIHGGGSDLVFPHHENESAQSRCAHGQPHFARYWLHNGMLTLGSEKMSKSVGNIETIVSLRERHNGEALRYALLSGQYRSSLAWSEDLLQQAEASLDRLYQALRNVPGTGTAASYSQAEHYPTEVVAALADDLNTPEALAALHAIASRMNRETNPEEAQRLRAELLAGAWLLGILNEDPETHFKGAADDLGDAAIDQLVEARNQARRDKDFSRADEIRDQLHAEGIELEDTRDGTRWKRR